MFIIQLTYKKDLSFVEQHLVAHREFLQEYYTSKEFIASGPCNPRTGGVILCRAESKERVNTIIKFDPFYREGIADYTIIEFNPVLYCEGFESFI